MAHEHNIEPSSRYVRKAEEAFWRRRVILIEHPGDEGFICRLVIEELIGSTDISISMGRMEPGQYHLRHPHPSGGEFDLFTKGSSEVHVGGTDRESVRRDTHLDPKEHRTLNPKRHRDCLRTG